MIYQNALARAEKALLPLGCAIMPILYLPGFGTSYREIKQVALWAIAVAAGLLLMRRLTMGGGFRFAAGHLLALTLLGCQLLSYSSTLNPGLYVASVMTLIAAIFISLHVYNAPTRSASIINALAPALLIISALVIARTYFGYRLVPEGNGFGALVGERNSCAALLALLYPLTLCAATAETEPRRARRWAWWLLGGTIIFAVLAMRTRAAWWMLGLYALAFLFMALRNRGARRWRVAAVGLGAQVLLASAILVLVPNGLQWSSQEPYWDSLTRMASASHSNGRVDLWTVGITMFEDNIARGLGSGNYSVFVRDYIGASSVDPMVFAFLRSDLPLFNDYLQAALENGVFGGIAFFVLVLVIPLVLLRRHLKSDPSTICMEGFAAGLACLALAVNACFDYPFQRPETIFFAAVLLSVAGREVSPGRHLSLSRGNASARLAKSFAVLPLAALALALLMFTSSLTLRKVYYPFGKIESLHLSWQLWPWDVQWNEYLVDHLVRNGAWRFAEDFVTERELDWPHDPSTFLSRAILLEGRGDLAGAESVYRRALFQVDGGRCVYSGVERYRAYLGRHGAATTVTFFDSWLRHRCVEQRLGELAPGLFVH